MKCVFAILAPVCAGLGCMALAVPGLRFGALLLLCAAVFCGVMAALSHFAETNRWAKVCRNVLLGLFCAGFVFFLVLEGVVLSGARGDADDVPVNCVIVLGAGVNGTEPSLILWSRLNAALQYIADKPDIPVIVSGGRGTGEDITEAECMARWLAAHGVEESRIWKEERSTSTRMNFSNSRALMTERGIDAADGFAFVTSDFHIYRAKMLAGVPRACGVAATLPDGVYYAVLELNYYVREAFALGNDLIFGVDL